MKKKNLNSLNLNKKLVSKLNFNSLVGGAEGNGTVIGNTCITCPDIDTCKSCGDLCTSNDPARCPKPPIRNNGNAQPYEEGSI